MMKATVKRYPCGQVTQTAIDAAIKLRSRIRDVNQINKIEIGTFTEAKNVMAGDPEKWRPETRESADHSLPYVVAIALMHGALESNHFGEDYLHNPDLLELIRKIKVAARRVQQSASGGQCEPRDDHHQVGRKDVGASSVPPGALSELPHR